MNKQQLIEELQALPDAPVIIYGRARSNFGVPVPEVVVDTTIRSVIYEEEEDYLIVIYI